MLIIDKIENNLKEELNQISYWPYLRLVYGQYSMNQDRNIYQKISKLDILKVRLSFLKVMFFGFKNFFRNYDYIFFGSTDGLKKIDNKYIDRLGHGVMDYYGLDKVLYIEYFNRGKYSSLASSDYKRVSYSIFQFLAKFFFVLDKNTYSNDFLDKINKKYNMKIDYQYEIKKIISITKLCKLYFKIVKPKKIFITAYTYKGVVKAAKELSIECIEFQHGVITNNYAYRYNYIKDKSYNPDKLIVYGRQDMETILKFDYLSSSENIILGGNFYLNHIYKHNVKLSNNYSSKIGVSLQTPIAKEMISIITQCAEALPDILFILIPRSKNDLDTYIELSNLKVYEELNCYQIINECMIHITGYSTCSTEAPSLGLLNIFVNIEQRSEFYYKEYIENNFFNYIVEDNAVSLVNMIKNLKNRKIDKQEIIKQNNFYFEQVNTPKIIENIEKG